MPPDTMTAPETEGSSDKPESQEAQATSQEAPKSQEVSDSSGRENPTNESSNGETRKPHASQFYSERAQYRKRIESLENTIRQLSDKYESLSKTAVSPLPTKKLEFDPNEFFAKPDQVLDKVLSEKEKALREALRKEILENDLPQYLNQREQTNEFLRKTQEGFDLLFPKSGPSDVRTPEERAMSDPDRLAKVDGIIKRYKLAELTKTNPVETAQLISDLLAQERKAEPKNPNVINKKLTGSTATGSPIQNAGGKKMATLAEIKAQLTELDKQLDKNPDLRYEDSFIQKNNELRSQLVSLAKELGSK